MMINSIQPNNNQSFNARLVDRVKLKQLQPDNTYKLVKAKVYELSPYSPFDLTIMEQLNDKWQNTKYMSPIFTSFDRGNTHSKFFITKIAKLFSRGVDNITCIMQTFENKTFDNELWISYLQASPKIANLKEKSPIKGSGEIAIYEAAKRANKKGFKDVRLCSTNDSFYEKMDMKKIRERGSVYTHFTIDKSDFSKFIEKVKNKYQF